MLSFEAENSAKAPAPSARFAKGQKFLSAGKHPHLCTVTDILETYNSAGELFSRRYVATHEFCGQIVIERDICETTIARRAVPQVMEEV